MNTDPIRQAIEVTGCDREQAVALANLFVAMSLGAEQKILRAVQRQQWDDLASCAYKLRTGLPLFADQEALQLMGELESAALEGDKEMVNSVIDSVLESLKGIRRHLRFAFSSEDSPRQLI